MNNIKVKPELKEGDTLFTITDGDPPIEVVKLIYNGAGGQIVYKGKPKEGKPLEPLTNAIAKLREDVQREFQYAVTLQDKINEAGIISGLEPLTAYHLVKSEEYKSKKDPANIILSDAKGRILLMNPG